VREHQQIITGPVTQRGREAAGCGDRDRRELYQIDLQQTFVVCDALECVIWRVSESAVTPMFAGV